jgi:hypothetical protein
MSFLSARPAGPRKTSKQFLTPDFCDLLESFDQETAVEAMSVLQDAAARRSASFRSDKSSAFKVEKNKKNVISKGQANNVGPKRPINRWMAFRRECT